jgi:hypothetical protein
LGIQVQPICCGGKEIFLNGTYNYYVPSEDRWYVRFWYFDADGAFSFSPVPGFVANGFASHDIDGANDKLYVIVRRDSNTGVDYPFLLPPYGDWKIIRCNRSDGKNVEVLKDAPASSEKFYNLRVYNKTRTLFYMGTACTALASGADPGGTKVHNFYKMNLDTGVHSLVHTMTSNRDLIGTFQQVTWCYGLVQDTRNGTLYIVMTCAHVEGPPSKTYNYTQITAVTTGGAVSMPYDGYAEGVADPTVYMGICTSPDINYHENKMWVHNLRLQPYNYVAGFPPKYGVWSYWDLANMSTIHDVVDLGADYNNFGFTPQVNHHERRIYVGTIVADGLPFNGLNSFKYDGTDFRNDIHRNNDKFRYANYPGPGLFIDSSMDFRNFRLSKEFMPSDDLM